MCVFESFDCFYMLDCTGFWAGNLEAPRLLSSYLSLPPFLRLSACLSVVFFTHLSLSVIVVCLSEGEAAWMWFL